MMFVHLHVHSHFSFGESPTPPDALARRASSLRMPALALTDFGVMHGVPAFVAACRRYGLRPVVGMEVPCVVAGDRPAHADRAMAGDRPAHPDRVFPVVLLARNGTGYRNLCRDRKSVV